MERPLDGLNVLDLSRVLAGPYCSMALGDLGARVIKIEIPGQGDDTRSWGPPWKGGESYYFLAVNRNKESLALNLKQEQGKAVFRRLVERADVLLENFRPGTMERLGLGYPDLAALNPRLVYCSVSGYGGTGPEGDRSGYDYVLQAEAGHMSLTGYPGQAPVRIGIPLVDLGAAQWALSGILCALIARQRTGRGQRVETSLLESAVSSLSYLAGMYFVTGQSPPKSGSEHLSLAPYQAFRGGDGADFVVCVGNEALWQRLCKVLDLGALAEDPRFENNAQRLANKPALQAALEARFDTAAAGHWTRLLNEAGVPAGPVREVAAVLSDPQVLARDMVWTVEHPAAGRVSSPGLPLHFSEQSGREARPAPLLGQHSEPILRELGYDRAAIAALRDQKVI